MESNLSAPLLSDSALLEHQTTLDRADTFQTPPRTRRNSKGSKTNTPQRKEKTTQERISLRVSIAGYKPDLQSIYDPSKSQQDLKAMLNQAIIHNNADSGDEVKSPDFPKTPLLRTMKESLLNFDVNLREGSSLGSIFNLCSATLGAGALSLPFAFSQCGLVAGTLFLFLAGFTTHLSIRLLIEASDKTTFNSYEMLTVQLFGGAMGVAVEFSILIFCFGTCIAYIVAVGDILEQGVLDVFDLPGFVNRDSLMILFWAFIMFPLSMLEKINSLRFASMFGVCSIFFLSFSISFHSIRDVILHDSWNYDASLWPESPTALVKSMPVVMFAFTCQVNVFSIYEELENKSAKRMNRVNVGAMKTCVVAYLLSGAFGYLDFGRTTQGNILKNYCVKDTHDPLMITAFICIVITIVMAYPLNIFPSRYTIEVILARWTKRREKARIRAKEGEKEGKGNVEEGSTAAAEEAPISPSAAKLGETTRLLSSETDDFDFKEAKPLGSRSFRHFAITLIISGSSLLIALKVPNINTVFGLMGATCSAFVCFVLPGAFAIKLKLYEGDPIMRAKVFLLTYGGFFVGCLSTVVTLWGIFHPEDEIDACPSRR